MKIKKKVSCNSCGKPGVRTYDTNKGKWARRPSCSGCGSRSFQYYNY